MKIEDCFRIGSVLKTRGLKGELQAFIDYPEPEKLDFDALFLEVGGKLVPYFVESFKMPQKNTAFIYLEDVDHIDKAFPLAKKDIYLPNKLKPKTNSRTQALPIINSIWVQQFITGFDLSLT